MPDAPAEDRPSERTETLLGVDFGDRRIGLALAGPMKLPPRPLDTLIRETDEQAAKALARIARDHGAARVVVGLPLNADGTESHQSIRTRSFAGRLRKALNEEAAHEETLAGAAVNLFDERWTSTEADDRLDRAGVESARRRKAIRDQLAAVTLLEDYLSARAEGE